MNLRDQIIEERDEYSRNATEYDLRATEAARVGNSTWVRLYADHANACRAAVRRLTEQLEKQGKTE